MFAIIVMANCCRHHIRMPRDGIGKQLLFDNANLVVLGNELQFKIAND